MKAVGCGKEEKKERKIRLNHGSHTNTQATINFRSTSDNSLSIKITHFSSRGFLMSFKFILFYATLFSGLMAIWNHISSNVRMEFHWIHLWKNLTHWNLIAFIAENCKCTGVDLICEWNVCAKAEKFTSAFITEELRINMNFGWWTCSSSSSRELYSWGNTFSLKYSQTDNPSWTLNLINFFSIHVLFLVIYILIIFSKFPYLHASLHSRSSRHVDDTSSMPMNMTAPNQRAAKWRN